MAKELEKEKFPNEAEVLARLRDDKDYYGSFGKNYLSNSDIKTLLSNPSAFGQNIEKTPEMLFGGYFHTCILEPDKLHRFKIVPAKNRNTNAYKEITGGELHLLETEVDLAEMLKYKLLSNEICKDLIYGSHCNSKIEYEVPGVKEILGNLWKGKADIINHDERLIIDIKTTSSIDRFRFSADTYNYDSQAFIYRTLFGYDFLFIVIDKNSEKINIFECSDRFYERGYNKVEKATEIYELYIKNKGNDPNQYIETQIL